MHNASLICCISRRLEMSSERLSGLTKKGINMETSLDKQCTGHPQSTPNCVGHPHAENMKLYAEDAAVNERPWELWEYRYTDGWRGCAYHPEWVCDCEYRHRTKKTININGFEVPSPLSNPPKDGEICYIVNLTEDKVYATVWHRAQPFFKQWLKSGIIHRTEEAAALHLKALLSFTRQL